MYIKHVVGTISRRFLAKAANVKKTKPFTKKSKTSEKKNFVKTLTPMEMFVKDVDPGYQRKRKGRTTQGPREPRDLTVTAAPRLREESHRRRLKDHNTVYVFRRQGSVVPECVYYEDEDMFLVYDASTDAEYRLLIYPRRLLPFPEDLTVPNMPNLVKIIEQLGDVDDVLNKRKEYDEASVCFHVKLGSYLHSKPFRVIFARPQDGEDKVGPKEITEWLVKNRRMSIDSHRMMRDYLVRHRDFYRLGSRFDLLPPYQPIEAPPE